MPTGVCSSTVSTGAVRDLNLVRNFKARVANATEVRKRAPRVDPRLIVISSFLVSCKGMEWVSHPAKKINLEFDASCVDENLLSFPRCEMLKEQAAGSTNKEYRFFSGHV